MKTTTKSIKKSALKVILPFSIALFFSFPILIYYVSNSFNEIKKNHNQMLKLKSHMESIYIIYSAQAKHRKNLFIRGGNHKDLDKYTKKVSKSSKNLYKEIDLLLNLSEFDKYKPMLKKIKSEHTKSMNNYDHAVNVFIKHNFDFQKADKLTRGHGKEIGKNILSIINEIETNIVMNNSNKYKELTDELIFLSMLIILAYSIVMYFIIKVILNPLTRIEKLSKHVSNINVNNLDSHSNNNYPLDFNDEIGNLINVFNNFASTIVDYNKNLQKKIQERTKELDQSNNLLSTSNKNLNDAINYSALLQDAIKPKEEDYKEYFEDSFVYWEPKNRVGGDIYFIDVLPNKDESLVMCIDCTGHSISGAFVTMIVKSIQSEIIRKLSKKEFDISPGKILETFNQRIKDILKQNKVNSTSNAGFDGNVLYINKEKGILKYAGAYSDLITIQNNKMEVIKSNNYSVGYKKCDYDYPYKNTCINFEDSIDIYISTDGFIDTIGGMKNLRFGKKRLSNLINESKNLPFEQQKEIYLTTINKYRAENVQVDDICLIGLKINRKNNE
jgi:serine phosphatase RsbU (regulator of sigma subunit)